MHVLIDTRKKWNQNHIWDGIVQVKRSYRRTEGLSKDYGCFNYYLNCNIELVVTKDQLGIGGIDASFKFVSWPESQYQSLKRISSRTKRVF